MRSPSENVSLTFYWRKSWTPLPAIAFSHVFSRSAAAAAAFEMLIRVERGPAEPPDAVATRAPPPPTDAATTLSPGGRARKLWCEPHVEHSTRLGVVP